VRGYRDGPLLYHHFKEYYGMDKVYMSHHPKVEINLITVPWQAYTQKVYSIVVGGSQLDIAFVG